MEVLTDDLWKLGFNEIKTNKNWSKIHKDKNSTIYTKNVFKKCDVPTFKVVIENFPYSTEFLLKMFQNIETSIEYTKYIEESKRIYEENETRDIVYQITDVPISFLKKRDLILAREFKIFEKGFVMMGKSTKHDEYPVRKDLVRSEVIFQMVSVEKSKLDENKSNIVIMYQTNIGMWVPGFLLNQAIKVLAGLMFQEFEQAMEYTSKL
eukprot:gene7167-11479_t